MSHNLPQKKRLVVINIVGLTQSLLGANTPHINAVFNSGFMKPIDGIFPALTTTAQASILTGLTPEKHGIVGNGWYFRELAEIHFWKQSNHLVQGKKIWQQLHEQMPDFSCSQLFWWYNMYADVDAAITPRPHYPADGRKVMDLYSSPVGLHQAIESEIGKFPFFNFWGPASDIRSSRWIVDCAIKEFDLNQSNLQLVYLPHLDYNMQRLGPENPEINNDVKAIDLEAGRLIKHAREHGAEIMILSEYGITEVQRSVSINRILREAGYLQVRESLSWELLDAGASNAFAVADHQVAHIYVKDSRLLTKVKQLLERTDGIEQVLDIKTKKDWHIDHPRSGELIAIAESGSWFDYYYWLDDKKAPDFARTVDIHNKPGYDPLELFLDPAIPAVKLKIATRLIQKKLGLRMLMDVIPLDTELVKGSHGRLADSPQNGPLLISSLTTLNLDIDSMTDIARLIKEYFIN